MMVVGIPIYVCATASVPIAAELIAKGISPGAALVFLVTGPATNAATVAVVWKTMGRRTALIYLGTVAFCALAGGLLLDGLFTPAAPAAAHHHHEMMPTLLNTVSAVALMGILVYALWPQGRLRKAEAAPGEETATLLVGGMTCTHLSLIHI